MTRRPRHPAVRWGASLLTVLTAHVGGATALIAWQAPPPPSAPPLAAVMIDLAPLPSAPTVQSAATEPPPPAPEPQPPEPEPEPEPPPPEPEPQPPEPEPPPPPPEVEPEVPLVEEPPPPPPPPKPTPPKPEKVRPAKPPKPVPPPAAAAAAPLPPSPKAAAPMESAPSDRPSPAVPQWRDRLLGHLERHKRYPRAAQMRRQEGVAHVRFSIDRQGNVLSVRLERSSDHRLLDQETVELVERASPLPPPPDGVGGARLELVVPVQFFLR